MDTPILILIGLVIGLGVLFGVCLRMAHLLEATYERGFEDGAEVSNGVTPECDHPAWVYLYGPPERITCPKCHVVEHL